MSGKNSFGYRRVTEWKKLLCSAACGTKQWQETLQQQQPQVIFVGLGVPRQELWIQKNRFLCPNSIWVGAGGSFDIWSGNKSRAPIWLRNMNLEWSYRLYQEPWRWRRMLALPKFFWRSLSFRE